MSDKIPNELSKHSGSTFQRYVTENINQLFRPGQMLYFQVQRVIAPLPKSTKGTIEKSQANYSTKWNEKNMLNYNVKTNGKTNR